MATAFPLRFAEPELRRRRPRRPRSRRLDEHVEGSHLSADATWEPRHGVEMLGEFYKWYPGGILWDLWWFRGISWCFSGI